MKSMAQKGVTEPLFVISGLFFLFIQCASIRSYMGRNTLIVQMLPATLRAPSVLASVVFPPVRATVIFIRAIIPINVPQPFAVHSIRSECVSDVPSGTPYHQDCRYSSSGMMTLPVMKLSRMPVHVKVGQSAHNSDCCAAGSNRPC